MPKFLLYGIWAFTAGAGIPVMAALNGSVGIQLGSARAAAVCLFAIALIASSIVFIISGDQLTLKNLLHLPPLNFLGGLIVALYILSVTALAPRFGVANTILFVMFAQLITSSLIDNFGLFGAVVHPIGFVKLIGMVTVGGGLIVTQYRSFQN